MEDSMNALRMQVWKATGERLLGYYGEKALLWLKIGISGWFL
jgi:hypothetical protein